MILITDELSITQESLYAKCRLKFMKLNFNTESEEYGACKFMINGFKIQYRHSKITPTKTGQFVTIWKRDTSGATRPFDVLDDLDFIIITSTDGDNFGQFVFPKAILVEKGVITHAGREGKRGIRVYPPWAVASNKQAEKTQQWQIQYFFKIQGATFKDIDSLKKLFQKV